MKFNGLLSFLWTLVVIMFCLAVLIAMRELPTAHGKPPVRSKFYDFSATLIDGEIKKPTTLYTDAREKVKFERLLRLKKSFMNELFDTAKERIFK